MDLFNQERPPGRSTILPAAMPLAPLGRVEFRAGIYHAATILREMATDARRREPGNLAVPLSLENAAERLDAEARRVLANGAGS